MPQKKNPDVVELVRGKTARVIGNLTAVLVLMKGQALAYNRDNQEDKEPLFDTVDTLLACLGILGRMLPGVVFTRDKMRAAATEGHTTATDLADYLVRKGIAFRDAHAAVGNRVQMPRGIILPSDIACCRVKRIDMSSVIIQDSRRNVGDTILNQNTARGRPGRKQ